MFCIQITAEYSRAMDILFKLHYILGLNFSADLDNFYDFLCIIYGIGSPKNATDTLHVALENLSME